MTRQYSVLYFENPEEPWNVSSINVFAMHSEDAKIKAKELLKKLGKVDATIAPEIPGTQVVMEILTEYIVALKVLRNGNVVKVNVQTKGIDENEAVINAMDAVEHQGMICVGYVRGADGKPLVTMGWD